MSLSLVQSEPESVFLWSVQSRSRVYMGQNCKSNYKERGKAKQIVQPFLPLHLAAP